MLGFAGIAIGRHFVPLREGSRPAVFYDFAPRHVFLLFVLVAALGYLHILLAVNFDVFEMIRQMLLPRFEQSWTRGRYGDAYALLAELGALLYLVPPIAGLVYARSKEFQFSQKLVVTGVLLLCIFYAFSSGTRHILAVYIFTFFGSYFLNKEAPKIWVVGAQGLVALVVLLVVTSYMLAFREVGVENYSFAEHSPDRMYIDHNMIVISQLTEAFPAVYGFLGMEIPYIALVHPIPRALWPGKPIGLSVSVESIAGANPDTTTLASTFIGEAYVMGGMPGVLFVALLFGAVAQRWNRVGQQGTSGFSKLLYVSGFLCAAITMRSMLWTTVTMLPTVALWLYGRIWMRRSVSGNLR
jgi:oligosaccharide repeat unit polymerase